MRTLTTKRLFTLKESARYLGRSPGAVRSLVWANELATVRNPVLGSKMYFDVHDLDGWIERNKVTEVS